MWRRTVAVALAALTLPVLTGVVSASPAASATTVAKPYDFDGDGRVELVVGTPRLTVSGQASAGGFVVRRGTRAGLSRAARLVTRADQGIPGDVEADDELGWTVASADFDDDGYADLAVTAGGDTSSDGAQRLVVVPGSRKGLDLTGSVGVGTPGGVGAGYGWASVLATGDLDGDGYPDLAVGNGPYDEVWVFRGGPDGLQATASAVLRNPGSEIGFGGVLATGDVDGDGIVDLVVGSYGYQIIDHGFPGAISLCLGARAAVPTTCRALSSDDYDLANLSALAVGNVTGDARVEIVAGVGARSDESSGEVHVFRLSGPRSAITADSLALTQSSRGIPGGDEEDDLFGEDVALADLDRDGWDDLVIGAPGENDGRGRVTIVHGARDGWATRGNSVLDQGTRGIPGRPQPGDSFGDELTLLDHDGDGRVDLDVAVPGENERGALTTLHGVRGGFTTRGARTGFLPGVRAPESSYQRFILGP